MEHPPSIGKYDLEEFLGGGMSHVYRARDRILGRTVCIKVLTPQGVADPEVRNRFLLEARMAGNFCHDNVVSIYDFGEDQGQPFLVMEFLRGDTLRKLMEEHRLGSEHEILQIALQLARALECVHSQHVIHRDIKPENVHVSAQRLVKLMDFGIAKAYGLSMTQAGFVLGTPYYMAPEQIRGEEITPSVDVYAFGVLLYELLTGARPFKAETPEAIFYSILNENADPAPLGKLNLSEPVRRLVLQCMSKTPDGRPPSFRQISAVLDEYLSTQSANEIATPQPSSSAAVLPPNISPVAKRPSQSGWWIAALIAVLVAGAAVFAVMKSHRSLPPQLTTTTGEMVLVPAGDFQYGESRERVSLPAFYVDKTEVSNAAYSLFCKATGCTPPAADPSLPVVNVNLDQAERFASWAGKRLPTDREWEKAARGTDGRQFPWGNTSDTSRANVQSAGPVAVNSYAQGASPYGALQFAGNVWELVNSPHLATPELLAIFAKLSPPATANEAWIAIRGGSFRGSIEKAVTWQWAVSPARLSSPSIGFRCAKDAPR